MLMLQRSLRRCSFCVERFATITECDHATRTARSTTLASCCWICRTRNVRTCNDQVEKIDPFNRAAPEVLAVRLAIYHGLKKLELMREIAKRSPISSRMTFNGLRRMPTGPEEQNQFRQRRRFSSTRRRNFPKRRSLNTILLATVVRWETPKTPKVI